MPVLGFDLVLAHPGFHLAAAAEIPLSGVTAITGASGSGKTSLLRAIAGLMPEARGRIVLGGQLLQDGRHHLPPPQRRIGYVFQEPRLFPHMTVARNLAYGARRQGRGRGREEGQAQVARAVEMLGLGPLLDRRPGGLSGGEARRVALARALAAQPRLLLLDEPLTGLDGALKAELMPQLAAALAAAGLPVLLVSHDATEIATLADRQWQIADGVLAGPQPGPMRLSALSAPGPGGMALRLGDTLLPVRVRGPEGRPWSLALPPGGCLLSAEAPGAGSALASLPARCTGTEGGRPVLEVAAQRLVWRGARCEGIGPGWQGWLTLTEILPKPCG